ncbi:helix-turn-helix domain-containing protein [Ferrovibrio sp.]|uniref:helix-turn-helix domain-containing protein n=1 Tax=Ferrovibrio sp. TaxID=1917215 RepID=UPI0035B47248
MSEDEHLLLTTEEAAAYLHKHPVTMRKWRVTGEGPAYIKVGRACQYRMPDIQKWLARKRHTNTGQYR